jgi:hypothetical protein
MEKTMYNQPTSDEVERLINGNLLNIWNGDSDSGVGRVIEILRHSARPMDWGQEVKKRGVAERGATEVRRTSVVPTAEVRPVVTRTHTKRSTEFCFVIDSIIHRLHIALGMGGTTQGLLEEVTDVLLNNTTDVGCMVKAAHDEPIFVLRGKDKVAAGCVLLWAALAMEVGAGEGKVADATECARSMQEYHTRAFPT